VEEWLRCGGGPKGERVQEKGISGLQGGGAIRRVSVERSVGWGLFGDFSLGPAVIVMQSKKNQNQRGRGRDLHPSNGGRRWAKGRWRNEWKVNFWKQKEERGVQSSMSSRE